MFTTPAEFFLAAVRDSTSSIRTQTNYLRLTSCTLSLPTRPVLTSSITQEWSIM
jgi:hypothetical protein